MITQIVKLDIIDSTQTLAKQMAMDGAPGGTIVIADEQTSGHGQFERAWEAKKGGLYASIILRPEKKVQFSPSLSLKAASVAAEALALRFKIKTKIKHPNDVLAWHPHRKKWLKVCGILIESSSYESHAEWFVIGVGVNLNNKLSKNLTEACSVGQLTGEKIDVREFSLMLIKNFALRYGDWLNSSI